MPLPSDIAEPRHVDGPFRILTICTGNICRSPQAASLLRSGLREVLGPETSSILAVESAGTYGLEGSPMDSSAAAEAVRLGVSDGATHVARQLTAEMVQRADLVLGMERAHRSAAVALDPSANRRAFTLTEFAAVLEMMPRRLELQQPCPGPVSQQLLAGVVADAADARGVVAASGQIDYDIEDPYRRAPRVYRRSADAIEAAVRASVRRLASLVEER